MQKITIDTRILVNGKMFHNSTESAYINMTNKVPSSYKNEKDRAIKFLLLKTNNNVENAVMGLVYEDKPEPAEKKESK